MSELLTENEKTLLLKEKLWESIHLEWTHKFTKKSFNTWYYYLTYRPNEHKPNFEITLTNEHREDYSYYEATLTISTITPDTVSKLSYYLKIARSIPISQGLNYAKKHTNLLKELLLENVIDTDKFILKDVTLQRLKQNDNEYLLYERFEITSKLK